MQIIRCNCLRVFHFFAVLVVPVLISVPSNAAEIRHRYSFATDASDPIGGADGRLVGGAALAGGAVVLDGISGYVDLPNGIVSTFESITFETWLTDNGSGNWSRILDFGFSYGGEDNPSTGYNYLFMSPQTGGGILRASIIVNSLGGEQPVDWAGTRLPLGSLKHIVWTLDASAQTSRLYVDGVLVGVNSAVTYTPALLGFTDNNWLGRSQYSADAYLKASITEFRIYDGALTEEEVQQNYTHGPDALAWSGPASLILQPASQTVHELQPATFNVVYCATPPVGVQWYRGSTAMPGATNDSYTLSSAGLADDGASFSVVISNNVSGTPCLATSSNVVLDVIPDSTAPALVSAASLYPDGVLVRFSEGVRADTATNLANYAITHAGGALVVDGAAFVGGPSNVVLSTAPQWLNTNYTLKVNNVRDLSAAANLLPANSEASFSAVPYLTDDIGSPASCGTLAAMADGFDATAGGQGFVGTSDQFSFNHKPVSGDFDIQVRLAGLECEGPWARAGLMARDGIAVDAAFVSSVATCGSAGSQFLSRIGAGGPVSVQGCLPVNYPDTWVRLRRTGDLFEGFASLDGQTWQALGSTTIALPSTLEVGLAATSGDDSRTMSAQFRDEVAGTGTIVEHLELSFEPLGPSSRRTALVISEIMYNAPSSWGDTNSLEFVEVYNSGLITEDLTGHRLTGEIRYTFPDGTTLAPGRFLVVAKDPAAAQSFYGVDCLGPYDGKLANGGGTLRLLNELGGRLLEIQYDNFAPWPVAADGTGHSLVLSRPSYGENDPRAWSASDSIGGSPGQGEHHDSDPARGVVINEFLAHTDDPQVDSIELFNRSTQPIDLSGAWLSDEPGTNKFRLIDGTTIAGRGFLVFDQNQLGFSLSADGEQIFLVNSNQTRVLDSVRFRGQANGVSSGRHPDGAPGFQELSSITLGTTNAGPLLRSLVINEIMYHPISESDKDEYLEIYNRSASPVNLSSWRIQGGVSYEFPTNTVIAAHGYLVVAENRTNLLAKYAQLNVTNTYGNYSGSLANGGERIALSMPEDLVSTNSQGLVTTNIYFIPVDEVVYKDGGRWGQWSDGGGSSLELIDPDADNRQPASWADSDESAKAAWTALDLTEVLENGQSAAVVNEGGAYGEAADCNRLELFLQGAGEVLIDDVEFLNNGGGNLLVNGSFLNGTSWGFGGVVRHSYVESGVGTGGSAALHLVSVARGDTGCNKAYGALSSVPVIDGTATGTIRAKVRWLKGARQMLFRLRGNWMEAVQDLNVPANCGTPGLPNSRLLANAGPAIYDVVHSPILPAANEAVVVTARAIDPDGVASLTLHYRQDPSTSYLTATLLDDGTGGDEIAGDGIYSATVAGQASGALVAFYVTASDGSATSQFPAAAPDRECLVHWGESVRSGTLGTYRLWVTAANLNFWASREKNANDPLNATFVYGDYRVVYGANTMYSASPFHTGAYNGPLGGFACDYEVNFPSDDRFLGSEPFVLSAERNNSDFWYDPTTQNDLAGTWIARKLGQQYNHRRHVHMLLNGVVRGDVYLDTQQPNSEMLDEYHPDDSKGELRKIESWFEFADNFTTQGSVYSRLNQVDKSAGGIDPKWYRWSWRPRVTDDYNQWFAFTNLVAAVNAVGSVNWEARVRTWMDVPNYFRPIAVHHICGSWDSYAYARGKNMYAYKPDDQGWRLLMWDIELSFAKGDSATYNNLYVSQDPALFTMMQSIPSIQREYLSIYQEAVDGVLLSSLIGPILDERYTNLVANGISLTSPAAIKNYITTRRTYLQGILPSAAFHVDGAGNFTVSTNSLVLTGTAPLRVRQITVNGIAYPLTWTGVTTWSLQVPLSPGNNNLILTGFDYLGNELIGASASVQVNYTGTAVAPDGNVVISELMVDPAEGDSGFVELYNAHSSFTFDLSQWRLNGLGYVFPSGSLLPPQARLVLVKNPFQFTTAHPATAFFDVFAGSLDADGETLSLLRPGALPGEEIVVDRVRYEPGAPWPLATGGSSLQLVDAGQDNSRVANWEAVGDSSGAPPQNVIGITQSWKYNQSGVSLGTDWRLPAYDDATWPSGPALLYVENAALPAPKNTPLTLGPTTFYFRTTFNYSGPVAGATLDLTTVVDDAAVVYLNGNEVYRLGMPAGTISYSTLSSRTIGDAVYEGPVSIPATGLVPGLNVIAVEVHQVSTGSSDIVFGMAVDVTPGPQTASTPGLANSVAMPLPAFPNLWLNELQADNVTGPMDSEGEREPWIELYNSGSNSLSLAGYHLSDNYTNLLQWAFPAGAAIPAGGFLTVWCDAEPQESTDGAPHAAFRLASGAGQVALSRITNGGPQLVDYLCYTNLPSNWSYGDVPDGQPFYRDPMFQFTPGATNNGASPPLVVFINEWMADNAGTRADPADGGFEDWFEIYNPGPDMVDLGGYFLTDNLTNRFQFEVPDNGHYTVPPGGYLLVWADNETGQNSTNQTDLHASFALSKGGEAIGIFAADGTTIDAVVFGPQATDVSEGRFPNGASQIFAMPTPTPGAANLVPNTNPTLDPMGDVVLALGQTLNLSAGGHDVDLPPQALTYSLVNPPAGAAIDPTTGVLTWAPIAAPSTNTVMVRVTDNGTPSLYATQSFMVIVVPPPAVVGYALNGDTFTFSWPSVSGLQYQVYHKEELEEAFWVPIGDVLPGTGAPLSFTNLITGAGQSFYRIAILPPDSP